jgi:hypothetical protein
MRNVIYDVKTFDKSFLTRGSFKVPSAPSSYERLPLTDVKHRDPFMMVIGSDHQVLLHQLQVHFSFGINCSGSEPSKL